MRYVHEIFRPFKLLRCHRCNDAIALHVNWHIRWCLDTVTFFHVNGEYPHFIQQLASWCWNNRLRDKKSKLKSWIRWMKAEQQPVACTAYIGIEFLHASFYWMFFRWYWFTLHHYMKEIAMNFAGLFLVEFLMFMWCCERRKSASRYRLGINCVWEYRQWAFFVRVLLFPFPCKITLLWLDFSAGACLLDGI